jgi:hypothetical protein
MMRRLVEQVDRPDPIVARAAKLLESVQPLAPSDALRRRVLASVVRERISFTKRRRWVARPAAFVAVLLGTAVAAAAFQKAWLPRAYQLVFQRSWSSAAPFPPMGTDKRSLLARPSRAGKEPVLPAPPSAEFAPPVEASPLTLAPAPTEAARSDEMSVAPGPPRGGAKVVKHGVSRGKAAPPIRGEADALARSNDGASLVLLAIQVLRREHDAVQAGQLLEDYLRAFPRGALREEAMALAVEAAAARGDKRESRRLVSRYERAFPDGRFGRLLRPR